MNVNDRIKLTHFVDGFMTRGLQHSSGYNIYVNIVNINISKRIMIYSYSKNREIRPRIRVKNVYETIYRQ